MWKHKLRRAELILFVSFASLALASSTSFADQGEKGEKGEKGERGEKSEQGEKKAPVSEGNSSPAKTPTTGSSPAKDS